MSAAKLTEFGCFLKALAIFPAVTSTPAQDAITVYTHTHPTHAQSSIRAWHGLRAVKINAIAEGSFCAFSGIPADSGAGFNLTVLRAASRRSCAAVLAELCCHPASRLTRCLWYTARVNKVTLVRHRAAVTSLTGI